MNEKKKTAAPKSSAGARIDAGLVRDLAALLDETGLGEIEYGNNDWHVRVARGGSVAAAPAPAAPALAPAAADAAPPGPADHPGVVTSPMVGVVYTGADPDSPPFVKVGDTVNEGQVVLLIEAMKVFNQVKAPRAGKIAQILIDSGNPVEFGEPLLIIE